MHPGLETVLSNINSSSSMKISDLKIDNVLSFITQRSEEIVSINLYDAVLLILTGAGEAFAFDVKSYHETLYLDRASDKDIESLLMFTELTDGLTRARKLAAEKSLPLSIGYCYRLKSKVDYRNTENFSRQGKLMYVITTDRFKVRILFFHKYKIK